MPIGQPSLFPTLDTIMQLVRSLVRDTFPGVNGQQGRIFTNDAQFTKPLLNEALRWLNRKLRNEGVKYPIRDGVVIFDIPPQATQNPQTFVNVSFDGYFDGLVQHGTKKLPGDLMQPLVLRQRVSGTNASFTEVSQSQEYLYSGQPQQAFCQWEWRDYAIWLNGANQTMDLMLRYAAGQLPINALPADFSTTIIHIQDCEDALAHRMAAIFGIRNNGDPGGIAMLKKESDEAADEMALAYVRQQQTIDHRRQSYEGGGSNAQQDLGVAGGWW